MTNNMSQQSDDKESVQAGLKAGREADADIRVARHRQVFFCGTHVFTSCKNKDFWGTRGGITTGYRPRRIDDLEAIAFDVLGYKVRDYYRMAAGEMQTMRANRTAFERCDTPTRS
jgi:hypothetical protein